MKKALIKSWKISLLSTFISGLAFGVIDSIPSFEIEYIDIFYVWVRFVTIITLISSSIPAIISGTILTLKIQNDIDNNMSHLRSSILHGAGLGGMTAFLISSFFIGVIYVLSFHVNHIDLVIYDFCRAIVVIVIGTVAGGLAGTRIHGKLLKKSHQAK